MVRSLSFVFLIVLFCSDASSGIVLDSLGPLVPSLMARNPGFFAFGLFRASTEHCPFPEFTKHFSDQLIRLLETPIHLKDGRSVDIAGFFFIDDNRAQGNLVSVAL